MKRVVLSILSTIAGVSALLSFKTHSGSGTDVGLPAATLPQAALPGAPAPPTPAGDGVSRGTTPLAGATAPGAPDASATSTTTDASSQDRGDRGAGPHPPAWVPTSPLGSTPTTAPTATAAPAPPPAPAPATTPATSPRSSVPPPRTSTPPPAHTSSAPPPPPPATSAPPKPVSHTYTGKAIQTRYGIVQVQVTMTGAMITNVAFVQLTATDSRSRQINQHAGPILLQETLTAQDADVDTVSGATYTSHGYVQSLQSALDQA